MPDHQAPRSIDDRCLAGTARTPAPVAQVHRWIDADGVVHYSDQPPPDRDHREHAVRDAGREPVEVTIVNHGAALPAHVTSAAISHAVGVGKVLADVLDVPGSDGLRMRVVLAGNDAAFRAAAGPRAPSSTGAYRTSRRTMVVRVRADAEATLTTLRHEIVHALLHEWVGPQLPPALEEGLATYFSMFETRGLGGVVDVERLLSHRRAAIRRRLAADSALSSLLRFEYSRFHTADRNANYDLSAALIAELMATEGGRHALGAVLKAQRESSCRSIDVAAILERRMPGGLAMIEVRMRTALAARTVRNASHSF